jgi:tyrosine-protein kinase Etk/Wzc
MNSLPIQQPAPHPLPQVVQATTIMHEDTETELSGYLHVLYKNRWLIAATALAVTLAGVVFAYIQKPTYEANMLIHVEEDVPGQAKNVLGETASVFDTSTLAAAEMELVKSRLVVASAIDNLRLYISAQPKYFPVIGKWIADKNEGISDPGVFGYGGFVWGNESIEVPVFNVPDKLLNRPFTLTAEVNDGYLLTEKESGLQLAGRVGVPLKVETEYGPLELTVESLKAEPGAQFELSRASRLALIEGVQKGLNVAERGRQSGIVEVGLRGSNPEQVHAILSEITNEYVRQNTERKTAEAGKSLAFINEQLPALKRQLEQAEQRYNDFRNRNGTINIDEQSRITLEQEAAAKAMKMQLEQRKLELLGRYTENHPMVIAVNDQLREVNRELRSVSGQIRGLPALEQELVRLQRDMKVNNDLYTSLLDTAQQLKMVSAATMSNVRLVDYPMLPEKPVSPNRPAIIAIALLLGLFLGVVIAFMKKAVRAAIDDPTEIEKILGMPVYATIPHSKMQKELVEQVSRKSPKLPLLAKIASTDVAVESIRNFRTALQFSLASAPNNIVLMTGPTEGIGKSFVSANLATVMAASGKKVMLIDGDFRNGHLHRYFDVGRQDGMTDAISGTRRIEDLIHRNVAENVDFIATGALPSNPSELLMQPGFGAILQQLSSQYDVVLIDAAPILAVTDTLIIGAHAGSIYLLTRAGITTPGEIAESVKRMGQAGLSTKGVLFNDLTMRPGRYGYGYTYGKYRQVQYTLPAPQQLIEGPQHPN